MHEVAITKGFLIGYAGNLLPGMRKCGSERRTAGADYKSAIDSNQGTAAGMASQERYPFRVGACVEGGIASEKAAYGLRVSTVS